MVMVADGASGGGGIAGDPAVVEGAAAAITTAAGTMTTAGQDVGAHGDAVVARWSGSASQAAHERIRHLSDRTDVGAEVVGELPKILTDYAGELRQAQADHAAGLAAAQAARTALSTARAAMGAAQAMDEGPERASAMRLSGEGERYAEEGVAAAAHAVDAAIARERTANTVAADAVKALTTRLAGMDPRPPGAIPPVSVRAIEAAEGYEDQGPPPAWVERTAQTAVDAASGALDTAYIVPQGFGYLILRNMGYSHEQVIARLESDHEKLLTASGAQTDSAVYRFFDLHDNVDDANAGTDGGGAREVVGAVGEVGWHTAPGALAAWGHANPDPGAQALAYSLDTTHDRLEDEWGTQTDTRLYQQGVLLGDITTVVAGPGAVKGAGVLGRAADDAARTAVSTEAARDAVVQQRMWTQTLGSSHEEALYQDNLYDGALNGQKYGPEMYETPTRITAIDSTPLPRQVAESFRGSSYVVRTLDEPLTLYRVYSSNSPLGPYWTTTRPIGSGQSISDSALLPGWGNTATRWVQIEAPPGTQIAEGYTAVQSDQLETVLGGGPQVWMQHVEPDWIVESGNF